MDEKESAGNDNGKESGEIDASSSASGGDKHQCDVSRPAPASHLNDETKSFDSSETKGFHRRVKSVGSFRKFLRVHSMSSLTASSRTRRQISKVSNASDRSDSNPCSPGPDEVFGPGENCEFVGSSLFSQSEFSESGSSQFHSVEINSSKYSSLPPSSQQPNGDSSDMNSVLAAKRYWKGLLVSCLKFQLNTLSLL